MPVASQPMSTSRHGFDRGASRTNCPSLNADSLGWTQEVASLAMARWLRYRLLNQPCPPYLDSPLCGKNASRDPECFGGSIFLGRIRPSQSLVPDSTKCRPVAEH